MWRAVAAAAALCASGVSAGVTDAQLPLSVSGRYFVDATGARIKLGCVNWYGFEEKDFVVGGLQWQSIDTVAGWIAAQGFNCVRLPWALELVDKNPVLTNRTLLLAQKDLIGKPAMEAMDAVIASLTSHGVMTILDNHMSTNDWCCSRSDGNGLWYTADYPETKWLSLWQNITQRYAGNKYVVGCDLRNELREAFFDGTLHIPTWGTGGKSDWRRAAIAAIKTIQAVNPKLLFFVEGLNYALDLSKVREHPIRSSDVSVPNKVAYSAHRYSFDAQSGTLASQLDKLWGYLLEEGKPYTAPVWLGEFGAPHESSTRQKGGWWEQLMTYLAEKDVSFSYWAVDGTQSTGTGRHYGDVETYGLLDRAWNRTAFPPMVADLQKLLR